MIEFTIPIEEAMRFAEHLSECWDFVDDVSTGNGKSTYVYRSLNRLDRDVLTTREVYAEWKRTIET